MRRLKSRANIIETASPKFPIRGCLGPGFTIAWPFLLARRSIKMPPFRFPD